MKFARVNRNLCRIHFAKFHNIGVENVTSLNWFAHVLILCGDFNGTFLEPGLYNKHDYLLQTFVKEQYLNCIPKPEHTFYHHAGTSSSQIDYILSSEPSLLQNYQFGGRDSENSFSHVKVACDLSVTPSTLSNNSQSKTTQTVRKLQWEKSIILNMNQLLSTN